MSKTHETPGQEGFTYGKKIEDFGSTLLNRIIRDSESWKKTIGREE